MDEHINTRPRRFGAQFVVTVLLILIAAAAGAATMWVLQVRKPFEENVNSNKDIQLGMTGSDLEDAPKLADKFVDEDKDYLPDPPTDPKQQIDPPTLVFCFIAREEPEKYRDEWKPFCDHLSKITGKPVEYLEAKSVEEQIKALAEGKLQVSGLNTGSVPLAVNTCGFIPVCRIPTNDPAGTHVEIIVPSDSKITRLSELKGHELTLTFPTSNSGYKAPIVLLKSDFSIEPEKDYRIRMSSDHDRSIEGIANGEYQSAAVAADMLARAETMGAITKDKYRSIYKSESFPSAALGYVWNLKPELAAKVKEALLTYDIKGTALADEFGSGDQTKFLPVKYKEDWALIRRIDQECAKLRSGK
jgi:phosphonate transport system substrate-binding protein